MADLRDYSGSNSADNRGLRMWFAFIDIINAKAKVFPLTDWTNILPVVETVCSILSVKKVFLWKFNIAHKCGCTKKQAGSKHYLFGDLSASYCRFVRCTNVLTGYYPTRTPAAHVLINMDLHWVVCGVWFAILNQGQNPVSLTHNEYKAWSQNTLTIIKGNPFLLSQISMIKCSVLEKKPTTPTT